MNSQQEVAAAEPHYRSGAVARLTGIPVETLRVWERRYRVVGPRHSAAGHRLYTRDEVARLSVVKQLVDAGHAIGSIAALEMAQLEAMRDDASRAGVTARHRGDFSVSETATPLRLAVAGEALGLRSARLTQPRLRIVAAFKDAGEAMLAGQPTSADVLLVEMPTLQDDTPEILRNLAEKLGARRIVVEYGLGPRHIERELREAGCLLVRAPIDISLLEPLLLGLRVPAEASGGNAVPANVPPPRRFDNRTLTQITMSSVALACECPHHIADLLMRLGNFETYSEQCADRSPADAALHRYLRQVAGEARAELEEALVRVAEAEGIAIEALQAPR